MNQRRQSIWFLIAIMASVLATAYFLTFIATDPCHTVIALGGDSGMTYHAYLYHILFERGVWTNCMNYPYGDNITYKGGLPLLSIPLSYLKNVVPISSEAAIGVMHTAISLSYVLAIVYTYKILRLFDARPLLAVLFSCLIILLSPQVFRLLGHFGLTYMCVIPMLFYWSIKYYHSGHWRYPVYICVFGILMSFSHLYFGGIIFVWVAFYIPGYFLFVKQDLKAKSKHAGMLMLSMVVLFAVLKTFFLLTDPVKDRPAFQSGASHHITYRTQIITSPHSPFWDAISARWKDVEISKDDNEGYTYLGAAAIIVSSISLIMGLALYWKKRDQLVVSEKGFQPIWLFIAFGALFLAMDVPFRMGVEWLFDYTYVFKQFRALGRFSWIFYYVITIYVVVVINNWYAKAMANRRYYIAYPVVILPLLVWGTEVKAYADFIRNKNSDGPGYYNFFFSKFEQPWELFLKEHSRSKNEFQAILALTFSNEGSEKLSVCNDESSWVMTIAGRAALQLHLPIIDAFIARESWSQAERQVRIVGGPFADKPILKQVGAKPFLLLHYDTDSLDMDSKYLLQASDYIGHYSQFYVYACYPERIAANDKKYADSVTALLPYLHEGDTCVGGSGGGFYINHFDAAGSKDKFFGTGGVGLIKGEDSEFAVVPVSPRSDSQLFELSCWFLLSRNDPYFPTIRMDMQDSMGKFITSREILTKLSLDNDGLWFRASLYFSLPKGCRSIKCILHNHPDPSYIAMDEFLFRPADALVISKDARGRFMVNNHLFKRGD